MNFQVTIRKINKSYPEKEKSKKQEVDTVLCE